MLRIFWNMMIVIMLGFTLGSSGAYAHKDATGIVKIRMDGFKQSQQNFKDLIRAAHGNDYDTVRTISISLAEWGQQMQQHFPAGSNFPPSEAADTIWSDAPGFTKAIDDYINATQDITAAAIAADKPAIMAGIKLTSDSCTSCHNVYRVK
jgi:cytochrome c556